MPLVPVPAPGRLPLVGHVPQLLRRRLPFLESLRELGPVATVRLGRRPVTVLNDHRLVRDVLSSTAADFGLSPHFRVMKRIIGNGLLATDGTFHRRQRKLLMPALQHTRLPAYAATMTALTEQHLAGWHPGQPLDADQDFMKLATEIVSRCLFSAGIEQREIDQLVGAVPDLMTWAGSRGLDSTGLLALLPTRVNRRFRDGMDVLHGVVRDVIADRRAAGAPPPGGYGPPGGPDSSEDLLAMMLQATDAETGEPMPDQQVHDETMSFLIASTESVSRTLTWTLQLLARHPQVRGKLQAEADEVLGGRVATWDDVPRLGYTRHVLTEVLRMYPPGYLISRTAVRDTAVRHAELGELPLPAGSMVMFSYYALHRDPALFPDPGAFRPERWTEEGRSAGESSTEAFLPFGLGPHGCLGESFAWTELTLVLASIAARWELRAVREELPRPVAAFSLTFDDARMTAVARSPLSTPPAPRAAPDAAPHSRELT